MTVPALYLLDTNIVGYILRRESEQARLNIEEKSTYSRVAVSVITEAEILFGLERKPEARRLRAAVERFFGSIEVLALNREAARTYGSLRNQLQKTGTSLSGLDMLIAAHAVSLGAILVSHDKAFQHIKQFVTVVDWAADVTASR